MLVFHLREVLTAMAGGCGFIFSVMCCMICPTIMLSFSFSFPQQENIPPLQRTMLEIIPLLRPTEHLSLMWSHLLRVLLCYLPGSEALLQVKDDHGEVTSSINHSLEVETGSHPDISSVSQTPAAVVSEVMATGTQKLVKSDFPNGTVGISQSNTEDSGLNSVSATYNDATAGVSSHLFGEKLVPILVDIFLYAPSVERCNISPEIIQGLGRYVILQLASSEFFGFIVE